MPYPSFVACDYPLMLDVTNQPILIVGGGSVGTRKARGLLDAGASRVTVVSLSFDAGMPREVRRIAGPYDAAQLGGIRMAFAATDRPEVNQAVVRDARQCGVLVCRADIDEADPGDFATPALLRRGPIRLMVSSGGSPVLASRIRDRLAQHMEPEWTHLAEAMQVIRPRVMRMSRLSSEQRRNIFRALAGDAALRAAGGGTEAVWAWALRHCPELATHA